jgi:iron-sulfur cluster repair protein YtfE (RIC family)
MKHDVLNFRKMSPSDLMLFLSKKHYPSLTHLFDRLGLRLPSAVRVNGSQHPSLHLLEDEYWKLETIVANQIKKNIRILFPFIDNLLEEPVHNAEGIAALEFELQEIHDRHMEIRLYLANLSELSHGFDAGINSSESMKITFSELHSLEQLLYRQFYLEDVLLMTKVNQLICFPVLHSEQND